MNEQSRKSIAVGIPTYCRGEVLLDTLRQVLQQSPLADEIIVVDQTPEHAPATQCPDGAKSMPGRNRL
ncbi:MAG: glycosyltransferase [Planctomycetia bacterium]|nr:glycosyltransferase [Planctomycetia bacterium]